jgi:hypothetical protein
MKNYSQLLADFERHRGEYIRNNHVTNSRSLASPT